MRARGLLLAIPLLAMLPEGLFSNVLYLPRVHNDSGFVTGVAVSSVEDHSLEVNLILTDPMGNEVRRKSFQLPPMGQIVGTLKDLIGSPDDSRGWLRVESKGDVEAMGLLFRSDGLISESPVLRVLDRSQFLNHVAVGGGWTTEVSAVNPGDVSSVCRVLLYDASGVLLSSRSMTLPARGQVLLDVGQYFNIETLLSGHLEIVGDQPLASSLTFRTRYGLATVGGDGPAVQGTDQSIPLVLPYLRNTGSNWTGIAVVNQTSGPAYVTLDAVSSEGVAVARVQRRLEAKAQFVFNINEVVGSWTGEGYLRLTSDAPVSGLQITGGGDPGTTSFAGWGGQRRFGTQLFVPHIAEIDDWQSRISLINISPVEGVLTVEAIDSQGRQLAVTTLRLASGRQVIAPVAELLHLRGVGGGSLRITSTVQLAGANLFANSVGLAAVAANPAASEETRRIPSSRIASQLVSATKGAEITFPYDPNDPFLSGFSLSIPPDAIDEDTTVTVDLYRPDAPYFKPTIRTSAVPCPPPSRRVTLPTTSAAPHSYSACELWQRAYSAAKHQYRQL